MAALISSGTVRILGSLLILAAVVIPQAATSEAGVRLKELTAIAGVRDHQLHGTGIVVGLQGTGDSTTATIAMLRRLLANKQQQFTEDDLTAQNVAMVTVTCDLPPFAHVGARLPVNIAAIGDASSLRGGILLQTPLVAADGNIYAVGQGPLSIGGYGEAGPAFAGVNLGTPHENIETVATLPAGAIVERAVPVSMLTTNNELVFHLNKPDFSTASVISQALQDQFGAERIHAYDAGTIALTFPIPPTRPELLRLIAQVEQLRVVPDLSAKIVINSRTGTLVVGHDVRLSTVAVSHAGLSLQVQPFQEAVTDPLNPNLDTTRTAWPDARMGATSTSAPVGIQHSAVNGSLALVEGPTVEAIVNALNAIGARPRDLIAIFEALERSGALHAELVVL